jgi:hypothetical protein
MRQKAAQGLTADVTAYTTKPEVIEKVQALLAA